MSAISVIIELPSSAGGALKAQVCCFRPFEFENESVFISGGDRIKRNRMITFLPVFLIWIVQAVGPDILNAARTQSYCSMPQGLPGSFPFSSFCCI